MALVLHNSYTVCIVDCSIYFISDVKTEIIPLGLANLQYLPVPLFQGGLRTLIGSLNLCLTLISSAVWLVGFTSMHMRSSDLHERRCVCCEYFRDRPQTELESTNRSTSLYSTSTVCFAFVLAFGLTRLLLYTYLATIFGLILRYSTQHSSIYI